MILIIDIKEQNVTAYTTLKAACRDNKWMSYSYLKGIKLSSNMYNYKGFKLCKV